ncbi:MAG: hypothetical protein ABUL58_03245 [Steroidobacter sp.]
MLNYALIIFGIAATGGLVLANSVLRGKFAPWSISILHAILGASGLLLVLSALVNGASSLIRVAFIILVIAAIGGFYLASLHLRKKIAPVAIVVVHALVAVAGFLTLAGAALGYF